MKVFAGLLILLFLSTQANAQCLTKSEARAKWPKRHLYWHTEHHCWDATPGGRWRYQQVLARSKSPVTPTAPAPLPKPVKKKVWKEEELPECCWPDLKELMEGLKAHSKGEPK